MLWPVHSARIVKGHRVASGLNGNPRFPGGTLAMQRPHFAALGLSLDRFHPGTLNISVSPLHYRVVKPQLTFRNVKWHPTEPAEHFSFIDCRIVTDHEEIEALVYYPHPETKPEHFQAPDVLELLAPRIPDRGYGDMIQLKIDPRQMVLE